MNLAARDRFNSLGKRTLRTRNRVEESLPVCEISQGTRRTFGVASHNPRRTAAGRWHPICSCTPWAGSDVRLPFTRDAFFDLFAAYNRALWPAVAALWAVSVLASAWFLRSRRPNDRWMSGLLAVQWIWSAVYHFAFFTRINPAAWLFGAIFIMQAALLLWLGVIRSRLRFASSRTAWNRIGWFLVAYALLYPAINIFEHGGLLTVPTFGLPCPTTIFTAGFLLLAAERSRALAIIPIIWSVVGGSAAFLLGVSADYALPVAGAALALFAWQKPTAAGGLHAYPAVDEPVGCRFV